MTTYFAPPLEEFGLIVINGAFGHNTFIDKETSQAINK